MSEDDDDERDQGEVRLRNGLGTGLPHPSRDGDAVRCERWEDRPGK